TAQQNDAEPDPNQQLSRTSTMASLSSNIGRLEVTSDSKEDTTMQEEDDDCSSSTTVGSAPHVAVESVEPDMASDTTKPTQNTEYLGIKDNSERHLSREHKASSGDEIIITDGVVHVGNDVFLKDC